MTERGSMDRDDAGISASVPHQRGRGNLLTRAAGELRRGENVGAYFTIVLALGLAIANLAGLDDPRTLASLTLGLLALLCAAILVNRHQNQQLLAALASIKDERPLSNRFLAPDCNFGDILARARASREVWLWGTTLASHIPALLDEIIAGDPSGPSLKILLLRPSSPAVTMAAYRANNDPATASDLNDYLRANLRALERHGRTGPQQRSIECRVTAYLAPYGIYGFDPDSPHGKILVRVANFRGSQNQRPTFWLGKEDDPYWYDHFLGQFHRVWAAAENPEGPQR
jgi:hypothetical protein